MASSDLAHEAVARSDVLEEAGDLGGAIAALDDALAKVPGNPWLLARRGRLFRIRKQWRRAIEDFDAALLLKPHAATTLFFRGICRAAIGEFDSAIEDFESCIRLRPNSADAYWELGVIHSLRKDLAGTIAAYKKAFELDPNRYPGLKDELAELERKLEESGQDE